jgi:hypothetical protein
VRRLAVNRYFPPGISFRAGGEPRARASVRVTVRLDADVVTWVRSMGPGYQPRMNDVLSAFMHAKLAGLLHGDDTIEPFRESWQSRMEVPSWGETERRRERGE